MFTARLEDRLSYRCSLISTRVSRFITPMLEEQFGLTLVNWRVLAVIGRYAPLSSKDVAQHTSTDAFFVSRSVEQLVDKELITRTPDSRDRRRVCLQLSPHGVRMHRAIEAAVNRIEHVLVADLSPTKRDAMRSALTLLDERSNRLLHEHTWQDFIQVD